MHFCNLKYFFAILIFYGFLKNLDPKTIVGGPLFFNFFTFLTCLYPVRPDGRGDPRVPVPPTAGRPGLGQLGLYPLGPGGWLVQQHRVERGATHSQAVLPRTRPIRVEQTSGETPRSPGFL